MSRYPIRPVGVKNLELEVDVLAEATFRFSVTRPGARRGSGLNRYGVLKEDWPPVKSDERVTDSTVTWRTASAEFEHGREAAGRLALRDADGKAVLEGEYLVRPDGGYELIFDISDGERFYGLGDQSRDSFNRAGSRADMTVTNVSSYIPIPFLMSSRGWGLFVNTTHRHAWDVGRGEPGRLRIRIPAGNLDLYLFRGGSFKELLGRYTELTGRPALPPKWSFGLWFICRMQANDFEVTHDALNFRDRRIPCDVIGLEPGWMETNYDFSTDKKWDADRFPFPPWAPNGPYNFIDALKRMGFRLELWLCEDYDLSYEAERRIGNSVGASGAELREFLEDDFEKDEHFIKPVTGDSFTKPEEPWFEHLKKFIDQGADFFKQDGSLQMSRHQGRTWGNGMTDEEMHNLHPLLYSQQMYDGFRRHTGRRPCCFTPCGWAGFQRYTGTWTGDTGGGPKTLGACLNLALSGHSTVTCDMEVTTKQGIHYGFLMPWAQVNSWTYFRHPWLLGDELFPAFRDYAELRSRLIPYIYTYAHKAYETGVPMMRPLALELPEDSAAENVHTQWFLGEELLVSAFSDDLYLPAGKWLDYWTGEIHTGSRTMRYVPPANRGGGLFLRENSVLPLGPLRQYVTQPTNEGFCLQVFLDSGKKAEFEIYDDDGFSFNYERGEYVLHKIVVVLSQEECSIQTPQEIPVDSVNLWTERRPKRVLFNDVEIPSDQQYWQSTRAGVKGNIRTRDM
jgi:alpha-glucosidase